MELFILGFLAGLLLGCYLSLVEFDRVTGICDEDVAEHQYPTELVATEMFRYFCGQVGTPDGPKSVSIKQNQNGRWSVRCFYRFDNLKEVTYGEN